MKKVFLFACVAFALASCGNKAASNEEVKEDTVAVATDSDEAAEVTTALEDALKEETKDPAKIEATLTKVKDEYAKLVEEGKVEEAKKYALDAVAAVKADAKTVGDAAKNTAESAATNAANTAKSAAETKVNAEKAKAEAKVNDAANKAADKVNDAANKANTAGKDVI